MEGLAWKVWKVDSEELDLEVLVWNGVMWKVSVVAGWVGGVSGA